MPSKINDPNNNIGPQNKLTQAVTANPPIFLLSGFAITIPRDQVNAPKSTSKTPINLPSRLGAPNKTKSPKKAITIPTIFFIPGFSLNKKYDWEERLKKNLIKNQIIKPRM